MLRKVFKYEWKTIFPLLLGVHGVGLAIAIICRIGINLMGGVRSANASMMAVLLLTAAIMAIGGVVFYTYFYTGYRFYKSVFAQQGYLTNTLPITADQLIWGKGLTAVIWVTIDCLWAIAALFVLILSPSDVAELIRELPDALAALFHTKTPMLTWLLVISVLLTPFFMTIQIYVAAAIGNLFTGHKLLATIGSYIGISFIQQILSLIILAVTAPHMERLGYQMERAGNIGSLHASVLNILTNCVLLSLVFTVLCSVGFYFLSRYVLNCKLNLE